METKEKSNGALFGLIVILIILIAGAIYIWQTNKDLLQKSTTKPEIATPK